MDTTLVWNGKPGDVKLNRRMIPVIRVAKGKGGKRVAVLIKADEYKASLALMVLAFQQQWRRPSIDGPVQVDIEVHTFEQHRQGPAKGLPFLDADACIKAALDALEKAGVIHDDAQVRRVGASKYLTTKDSTRIWVRVRSDEQVERDEDELERLRKQLRDRDNPFIDPHGGMAQAGGEPL